MKRTILVMLCLSLLAGCSKEEKKEPPKKEVQTYKVTIQKVQSFVEATGTVQPDLEGGAKILTPVAGSVQKIFVKVGDRVNKGAALAAIRSPEVSDAQAGYLSAMAQFKQAERSYNLNKKLYDIGAVTQNDMLTSESTLQLAKATVEGYKKKLAIYNSSPTGGMDTLIIKAPIAGNVVDIQAHIGDRFDTGTPLMAIANSGKSLIVANIFDTDIGKFNKGKEVTFTSDIFTKQIFKGIVTYVSDVEDADSKTIKTYIRPLGTTMPFKQNMFLKIRILEGEKSLPVVPKSTIIYKDGKFYAKVKKHDSFESKEVKPVRDVSDLLMAVDGLSEGDIIASAAIDQEQP